MLAVSTRQKVSGIQPNSSSLSATNLLTIAGIVREDGWQEAIKACERLASRLSAMADWLEKNPSAKQSEIEAYEKERNDDAESW